MGKWFYSRDYPACSFTIERMALEKHIARDATGLHARAARRCRDCLARLKAGKPVTIVTMGDSLTDKQHWANRQRLWAEELVAQLKRAYGSEVTWVNPAIGGTTLSQNVILIPRWLQDAPSPDLVMIWFGGNDWDSGVRGQRYRQYLEMAVDQVRRAAKGQAEVMMMTTCPGFAVWETRNELCRAAFDVARERKTELRQRGRRLPQGRLAQRGAQTQVLGLGQRASSAPAATRWSPTWSFGQSPGAGRAT